jgi:hypothetical protein
VPSQTPRGIGQLLEQPFQNIDCIDLAGADIQTAALTIWIDPHAITGNQPRFGANVSAKRSQACFRSTTWGGEKLRFAPPIFYLCLVVSPQIQPGTTLAVFAD